MKHTMETNGQPRLKGLICGFLESVERFPLRHALVVNDKPLTFVDLRLLAAKITATILRYEEDSHALAALLAYRSPTSYAGILGILGAGKAYLPLNPKFPVARTREMLSLSQSSVLIVGKECHQQLVELLTGTTRAFTVILPDISDSSALSAGFPQHRFIAESEMSVSRDFSFRTEVNPRALAYLLFTSGSSGRPKGVPITQANVRAYVEYVCDRYEVTERDRFSQEFDLTFDLSVHDLFVCWERGACLFCIPGSSVMAPAKFIRENNLTMWFSVPSVIGYLERMRLLRPGAFPSLRCSLFCGEALPSSFAKLWQEAASQSIVENLYGPTETTIAISHYRWDKARSPEECQRGIVPIGWTFTGQRCTVVNDKRQVLPPLASGELCLSGSQVSSGYWHDPQKTQEKFVSLPDLDDAVWYRTGDRVKQAKNGCLHYLGRIDHQVKIKGFRVELQEIEAVVREACGGEHVICHAWPMMNGIAGGVVAFVSGSERFDKKKILAQCRQSLPDYMVPSNVILCDEMPLNSNGKVDRNKLVNLLEGAKVC
jgi:amino acid adenylation domain-containing protein